MTRARVLVVIGVAVLLVGIVAALALSRESKAETIAAIPERILDMDAVALTLRSSLTSTDGTTKFTDSEARLQLDEDRSYVDLPEVLRNNTLELVSEGLILYVTVPQDLGASIGNVRWLRLDTASRAEARGAYLGAVPDPATVMLSMAGATGDSKDLGEKQLDDRTFRVYRVKVKPELMAKRLGRDNVASANKLGSISLEWEADVWLDDDDLPHRVQLRTDVVEDGEPAGTLALDLRLGQFNEELVVGIPPNDAVRRVGSIEEALELLGAA